MNANTAMEANRSNRTPWIMVGAVIAAAVLFGIALIMGNSVLIVVAVAVVVLTAIAAAVLPRRVGQPISFAEEFPANTIGPRATVDGDSTPPINTRQHPEATAPDPGSRDERQDIRPEQAEDEEGAVWPSKRRGNGSSAS